MKKRILLLLVIPIFKFSLRAQTPQFAVVRPDGTTFVCPTFDSAYSISANGDNIYLPGGTFTVGNPINKRLHIYGAGYDQDSSYATGITRLNSLTILQGADNGSMEGVWVNAAGSPGLPSIAFGDNQNFTPFSNYTISKCYLTSGINFSMPSSNIAIYNNYIGHIISLISVNGQLSNSSISNNVITGAYLSSTESTPNLDVSNNIFFYYTNSGNIFIQLAGYSVYRNNIFQTGPVLWASTHSYFHNNTNGYPYGTGNIFYGTITETFDLTFADPGPVNPWGWYDYDVHNNYHVRATSLCHNTGTDGNDIGQYGGVFPWTEGSIPSNPHIYFKQVSPLTNASGQLPVQFKVRTGN